MPNRRLCRVVYTVGVLTIYGCSERDNPANPLDQVPSTTPQYDVVVIAAPGALVTPRGLSTDGRATGTLTFADGSHHAFRWLRGMLTDLGSVNGRNSTGVGINASGDVAGYAGDATNSAVVWKADGTVLALPGQRPVPRGITNSGMVVTNDFVVWRNGQTLKPASVLVPLFLFVSNADELYVCSSGDCWVNHSNGSSTFIMAGRNPHLLVANDSGFMWVTTSLPDGCGGDCFGRVLPNDTRFSATDFGLLTNTYIELVPGDFPLPVGQPYVTSFKPVVLNNLRTFLQHSAAGEFITTTRGAFFLDPLIVDHAWHIVQAVDMNDAGQILAIARRTSTGDTAAVVLTPRVPSSSRQ